MKIDKIFILSAPSSIERRKEMETRMEGISIPYEFYISGETPFSENIFNLIKDQKEDKRWLNHYNEVSVTLAHLNIISISKSMNYESVLILEDDILFNDDFNIKIEKVLQTLPDDFNIAYLFANIQTPYDDILINDDWLLTRGSSMACSYILSNKAFDPILEFYRNDYQVIDVFFYHWTYKNPSYVVRDFLVVPDPGAISSINKETKKFNVDYSKFNNTIKRKYKYKWSICICSLPNRISGIRKILTKLENQVKDLEIEILYLGDNRTMTIGEKRNRLVEMSKGEYISFIDDDDDIREDYVDKIYEQLNESFDVICFNAKVLGYSSERQTAKYSINYTDQNFEKEYLRKPNHLMCIKSEHYKKCKFTEENKPEDFEFASNILKLLKTEKVINEELYIYDYDPETSESPLGKNNKYKNK